ncbi:hypothetical protein [Echinicola shivajiensis]|uniref:hypothetical protein n=1 Tax=Echinicola shivajiensis TaxID=1035916 RepID=UPI001BFCC867|nr:hypothetical protein [Echinicola shivajiensis]
MDTEDGFVGLALTEVALFISLSALAGILPLLLVTTELALHRLQAVWFFFLAFESWNL